MSDPRSIMEGPPRDTFETSLLDAARQDRMPESSRARVLHALGVAPLAGVVVAAEIASSAHAAPAATAVKTALWGWGKILGLAGVVVPAAALGGWLLSSSSEASSFSAAVGRAAPSSRAVLATEQQRAPVEQEPEVPRKPSNVVSWEELLREEAPGERGGDAGTSSGKAPGGDARADEGDSEKPTASSGSASLADELTAIRRARSTLASGQASSALEQLDGYAARFPEGRLRQEATVLRIEALVALGRRQQAETLARPFLEQNSAYAARLRSVLDR